jgi:membrane-bound metal-dependent hydrolase YbcI (DUF457 family)
VAAALGGRAPANDFRLLLLAAAVANAPDLDFAIVALFDAGGWHRSFTHSLAFSLAVGLAVLAYRGVGRAREAAVVALALMSHAALDFAATLRAGGVQLFWPASRQRFKLGLFGLSEFPFQFRWDELLLAVLFELLIFGPPLALLLLVRRPRANAPRAGRN